MNRFDRNKGIPGKAPKWLIRYRAPGHPTDVYEPSRGSKRVDDAYMAELRRQLKAGTWVHPSKRGDDARFAAYAIRVIDKRVSLGVRTADKDERGHVNNWLIAAFGNLLMRDLVFTVIKKGFEDHILGKGLAGRTIHNIHSTLRCIMTEAAEEGLMELPPPLQVRRRHLPPQVDKDPKWRNQAIFDIREVRAIAEAEHIPSYRKLPLLTYFCTGARFIELVHLRVRDIEEKRPLNALLVMAAKTRFDGTAGDRRRVVPIIPDLQRWLDWWLETEYEQLFGHRPGLDDLLFPSPSPRRRHAGGLISYGEFQKQFIRHDLPGLGARHRGIHDARRTFQSLLRNAGVEDSLRREFTHVSVEDRVLAGYTLTAWERLCVAIQQPVWKLPHPQAKTVPGTNVVQLRR